ncbi:Hypothetical protein GSB_15205 [Giardia duodenalis]|uniref:Phosphatidylinositol transfer protein n=2 Tax=Giardia intestinalis TaxID=5741 RepID=C6LRD0_GIAIB|nr:Hypothetical protein GL50581_1314 [Giardia intestinalis ATCC 50581]ESU41054.1 Hypothetical protein GSB_15205 [Giardia intestinalis]
MQTQTISFLMPLTALQTSIGLRFVTARGFPGDQRRLLSIQHLPGSQSGVISASRVHFKDIPEYINLPLAYQGIKTKIYSTIEFPYSTYVARSPYGSPRVTVEMRLYFQDCYCGEPAPNWMENGNSETIDVLADCLKKRQRDELKPKIPHDWICGAESNVSCTTVEIIYSKESNIIRQFIQRNLINQLKMSLKDHFVQIMLTFDQWDKLTLDELRTCEESAIQIKQCMYGARKQQPKSKSKSA